MRILEIIFLTNVFVVLVALLTRKKEWTAWMRTLAFLAAALGIAILWTERYRWQMYPAYLVAAILVAYVSIDLRRSRRFPVFLSLVAILLVIGAAVFATVLPIFSLPVPDGPYAIGTVTQIWFRPVASRDIAPDWAPSRKITVQLWYPAAPGQKGRIAPYRGSDSGWFLTHYLGLVRTHARIGVPVSPAQATYPVLLFSPAWGAGRTDYTTFYEELASHGFVVAAMEHVKDLDGPFIGANLEAYREADALVRRRAEDASYVLDELTKWNESDPEKLLARRLDLSRVGILGHSFGGAAAAETCWLDRRFKAGIDLDGDLFGEAADAGASQPFFFMHSDGQPPTEAELHAADSVVRFGKKMEDLDWKRKASWLVNRGGYEMVIRKSLHLNYSDRPLFSPIKRLTGAGEIGPRQALQIADAYVLAFFDRTLNQQPETLLDGSTERFPEVIFKTYPAPVSQETSTSISQ
jgi:predicted dienelactone hydrolase